MHPSRPSSDRTPADDTGSAALEFILAGVVLLVPLVYVVIALGLIQEQSLGVATGARQIARAVSTAPDAPAARRRAAALAGPVLADYGVDTSTTHVSISCRPVGGPCPRADGAVVVTVTARVALPLVPPVLSLDRMASVPVEASAVQRMSRLWGTTP